MSSLFYKQLLLTLSVFLVNGHFTKSDIKRGISQFKLPGTKLKGTFYNGIKNVTTLQIKSPSDGEEELNTQLSGQSTEISSSGDDHEKRSDHGRYSNMRLEESSGEGNEEDSTESSGNGSGDTLDELSGNKDDTHFIVGYGNRNEDDNEVDAGKSYAVGNDLTELSLNDYWNDDNESSENGNNLGEFDKNDLIEPSEDSIGKFKASL